MSSDCINTPSKSNTPSNYKTNCLQRAMCFSLIKRGSPILSATPPHHHQHHQHHHRHQCIKVFGTLFVQRESSAEDYAFNTFNLIRHIISLSAVYPEHAHQDLNILYNRKPGGPHTHTAWCGWFVGDELVAAVGDRCLIILWRKSMGKLFFVYWKSTVFHLCESVLLISGYSWLGYIWLKLKCW